MPTMSLDSIEPAGQALVHQMLAAVVDRPDLHINLLHCQNVGHGQWQYFIGQTGHGAAAFPQHSRLPCQLFPMLVGLGFLEPNRNPQYRKGSMCFTDAAIEWYRAQKTPKEHEVQQGLAKALMAHFRHYRNMHRYNSVDLPAVAAELGVPVERVIDSAHLLIEVGLAQRGTTQQSFVEVGWISLTPQGIAWVNDGFPTRGATHVALGIDLRVELNVTIHQFMQQVQTLEVPDDFKQQLIEAIEELEREPTPDKLQKVMSFGADTATFGQAAIVALPFIMNFLSQTADRFNQLFHFTG